MCPCGFREPGVSGSFAIFLSPALSLLRSPCPALLAALSLLHSSCSTLISPLFLLRFFSCALLALLFLLHSYFSALFAPLSLLRSPCSALLAAPATESLAYRSSLRGQSRWRSGRWASSSTSRPTLAALSSFCVPLSSTTRFPSAPPTRASGSPPAPTTSTGLDDVE